MKGSIYFAVLIRTLPFIYSFYMFLQYGKIMKDIKKSTTELCWSTVDLSERSTTCSSVLGCLFHGSCQAFCIKQVLLVNSAWIELTDVDEEVKGNMLCLYLVLFDFIQYVYINIYSDTVWYNDSALNTLHDVLVQCTVLGVFVMPFDERLL